MRSTGGEDARVGEPSKTCLLKICFPDGAWTSIAVLLNPCAGLHRDIHNSAIHRNCVIGLGDYSGGRIWLEDASGDCPAQLIKDNVTQELRGTWLDMHDTPICFNARHRFHMVEPHDGKMWALAAYTPLIYRRASVLHIDMLKLCGFPTSAGIDGPHAHQARFHKCENKRAMMLMRIRTQAFRRSSGLAAGLGWSFVAGGFAADAQLMLILAAPLMLRLRADARLAAPLVLS